MSHSNRPTLVSRRAGKPRTENKGSKIKELLSEDETTKAKTTVANQDPVVSNEEDLEKYWELFAGPVSIKYEHPYEDKVPAGIYYSEIKKMEIRKKGDQVLLDVGYWIENAKGIHHILQSYPLGSMPFVKLRAAIDAAGINVEKNIRAAIGMSEKIRLAYVSKYSDIGSIIERIPCEKLPDVDENGNEIVPQEDQDDDSEFDDFLPAEE